MSTTVNSLEDFRFQSSLLVKAYESLLDSGLLPIDGCDPLAVKERIKNIGEQRFTVAVCGQVKAGKSTLINALVCKAPVLPSDDTPMTAKITLLRYREHPGLEVHFWSRDEWNELRRDYGARPDVDAAFQRDVERAYANGFPDGSWILPEGRVVHEDNTEALGRYVAASEKGGLLSPYVKEVILYHTNEHFKDVDIVDTPGLNDPNLLRTQVTEKWIAVADAVLYVTYGGFSLSEADVTFIRTYLASISQAKRVLAVTKIDTVDRPQVERHIESLRRNPKAEIAAIVAPAQSTAFVAAGARLLRYARARGVELEDLAYVFRDPSWMEGDRDGMDTLQSMVEARLMARRGQEYLDGHIAFMRDAFKRLDVHLGKEREALRAAEETASAREGELIRLQDDVRVAKHKVGDVLEELREERDRTSGEARLGLKKQLSRIFATVFTDFSDRIKHAGSVAQIPFEATVALQSAWDRHGQKLGELLTSVNEGAASFRSFGEQQLKAVAGTAIKSPRLNLAMEGAMVEAMRDVEAYSRSLASDRAMQAQVERATNWWQRLWDTSGGVATAQSSVANAIKEGLEKNETELEQRLGEKLTVALDRWIGLIEADLRQFLATREQQIDAAIKLKSKGISADRAVLQDAAHKLERDGTALQAVQRALRAVEGAGHA